MSFDRWKDKIQAFQTIDVRHLQGNFFEGLKKKAEALAVGDGLHIIMTSRICCLRSSVCFGMFRLFRHSASTVCPSKKCRASRNGTVMCMQAICSRKNFSSNSERLNASAQIALSVSSLMLGLLHLEDETHLQTES